MYSPKIDENLIPVIYRIAKAKGMHMTTLVNEILQDAINKLETGNTEEGKDNPDIANS